MEKKYRPVSFQPWPENERRLELAGEIGLHVSELLNEAVKSTFDDLLKKKSRKIQLALQQAPA
jgi:hypothetical protein